MAPTPWLVVPRAWRSSSADGETRSGYDSPFATGSVVFDRLRLPLLASGSSSDVEAASPVAAARFAVSVEADPARHIAFLTTLGLLFLPYAVQRLVCSFEALLPTCPSRLTSLETVSRMDALAVAALGLGWLAGLLHPPRAAWVASRDRWYAWAIAAGVPLALSFGDAFVALVAEGAVEIATTRGGGGATRDAAEAGTEAEGGTPAQSAGAITSDRVHLWLVVALAAAAAAAHLRAAYRRGILASYALPRGLLGLYVWASLQVRPAAWAGGALDPLRQAAIYAPATSSRSFHRLLLGLGVASLAEFSEVWSVVVLALGVGLAGHSLAAGPR